MNLSGSSSSTQRSPKKPPTAPGSPSKAPAAQGSPKKPPTAPGSPSKAPAAQGSPKKQPTAPGSPSKAPAAQGSPKKPPTAPGSPNKSPAAQGSPKKAAAPSIEKVKDKRGIDTVVLKNGKGYSVRDLMAEKKQILPETGFLSGPHHAELVERKWGEDGIAEEEEESVRRYKQEAVTIIGEYFSSDDIPELRQSLKDLAAPEYNPVFLKLLITLAMDRTDHEKQMASTLLSALLHIEVFSTADIVNGFVLLFESAEDTALDNLDASNELGLFLARAVIDDVLTPLNLGEIMEKLPEGCAAAEAVRTARTLAEARHAGQRIHRCWGGGMGRAVEVGEDKITKFLEDYDSGVTPVDLTASLKQHDTLDMNKCNPDRTPALTAAPTPTPAPAPANIEASTARYMSNADKQHRPVDIEVGDFVWAVLTKDRVPTHEYNELKPKTIGPFEIVEKVNPNAYRLCLPSHIRTHDVFNVEHLRAYTSDNSDDDASPKLGENDADALAIAFMNAWDRNGRK